MAKFQGEEVDKALSELNPTPEQRVYAAHILKDWWAQMQNFWNQDSRNMWICDSLVRGVFGVY